MAAQIYSSYCSGFTAVGWSTSRQLKQTNILLGCVQSKFLWLVGRDVNLFKIEVWGRIKSNHTSLGWGETALFILIWFRFFPNLKNCERQIRLFIVFKPVVVLIMIRGQGNLWFFSFFYDLYCLLTSLVNLYRGLSVSKPKLSLLFHNF